MKKHSIQGRSSVAYTTTEIRAERPVKLMPIIIKEYIDDGTRMYLVQDGQRQAVYIADIFDKNFLINGKKNIAPETYKGENQDKRNGWMK